MPRSNKPLAVVCLLLFLLSAAFHLLSAAKGHPHFRDQHFGPAQLIASGETDWLHPVIPGFTANDSPVVQELPLWQGLAGLAMKIMGPWAGWASVVSLLIFATAAWPLHALVRAYGDSRRAWWALAFFLAQPLSLFLAGSAQVDGLCLVVSVWFLYGLDRMLATGRVGYGVLAALFGALTAVSKLPLFFCIGVAGAIMVLMQHRADWRRWAWLAGVGIFGSAVFFIWTRHTDQLMAQAEFPLVELRVGVNPEMKYWYFGDLAFRLDAKNWVKGGWHFLNGEMGSFALIGLLLLGFFTSKNVIARVMIAGGLAATLVFAHLVLHHWHYFMMFAVPSALLCADAVAWIEERVPAPKRQWLLAMGAFVALALSGAQGLIGSDVTLFFDPYPKRVAGIMAEHSQRSERLMVIGGAWGGRELILAERKGMSIWNAELLEKPESLARLKALGFTKLVLLSESPLLHSVQAVNPGQADRKRRFYQPKITPLVQSWPVVYRDENIYIAALP